MVEYDNEDTRENFQEEDGLKEEEIKEDSREDTKEELNKNYIWISDIYSDYLTLLDYYSELDKRLKWVGISDILYGRKSIYKLNYDENILQFVDDLLFEIDKLSKNVVKKNFQLIQEERDEYNRLMNLNKNIIYSRISFCIHKWFK